MNITNIDQDGIRREREKLDRLVDEALKNGTPIGETYEVMAQCKKIERMMAEQEAEDD